MQHMHSIYPAYVYFATNIDKVHIFHAYKQSTYFRKYSAKNWFFWLICFVFSFVEICT